jgi:peptide/nickel transport system permease protein
MTFSPERRAAAYISSPQQVKDLPSIVKQLGLDDPFYIQYFRWIKEIGSLNLGWSIVAARPVWDAFWHYFPITLELNLFTSPLIILFGIWLGTIAGIHRDTYIDHSTRIFAIIGWSLPTFLFALIMLMIFYGYFDIFPPGILSDDLAMFIRENPDQFKQYTRGIINARHAFEHDRGDIKGVCLDRTCQRGRQENRLSEARQKKRPDTCSHRGRLVGGIFYGGKHFC